MSEKTFAEDVTFLEQFVSPIVLGKAGGPQVVVVPEYQGRTMTSTTGYFPPGQSTRSGNSYGWINYDLIQSQKRVPQINLYGGEDRYWLGPEGGQFSVFFDPGAPMDFAVWRVPEILDTASFDLVSQDDCSVSFEKQAKLTNHSEFVFDIRFDRQVCLLDKAETERQLGTPLDQVHFVCHESRNGLTNSGKSPWTQETGLLGIWMLCMNRPSPGATVIVPFKPGEESDLGPIVNADYFGKLDETRLRICRDKNLIYFLGDGKLRSKLGLTFPRVESYLGSWDAQRNVLTVVQFNLPDCVENGYTNNLWEIQDDPFAGDVINSYNDGPNESGGMLGPFYELETLSPALALAPGERFCHIHRTFRLEGERAELDRVASTVFGANLDEIESQFAGA